MTWDFALILFILLVITGAIWLLDVSYLRKHRRARAVEAMAASSQAARGLAPERAAQLRQQAYDKANRAPWWVEYGVSFFPVILFVFLLRSFVVEPFRIPSGSMLPTLQNGDLILVNKYQYGIRLPVIDKKIIPVSEPKAGDVVVFRYPVDTAVDYIKRVVGVAGDVVEYKNKVLSVNGTQINHEELDEYYEPDRAGYTTRYREQLQDKTHDILLNPKGFQRIMPISRFPHHEACDYDEAGVRCTVPEGHYFMMGDNRDNSLDSRYWGFVPDENIVGRAFFIWMNFSEPSRIGRFQ